jgi:molecular chaperone DnaK
MSYQLGIDLGTTYTAAAVCRSSDRRWVEPEVVTLGTRSATVPSVLFVASDGSVLIGEAAERRALTDPDRVVREFKRRIGDPTPVVVAGRAWAPEELSARLVRWVVDRVAEREGGSATGIALTHPASWGTHKKELLAAALAGQGLTVTFLAEPQAAALHYAAAERISAGSTIAVYDLGGGTFDAAVVRKGDPGAAAAGAAGFGLLGRPEGLERLGGVDFDEAVFEHVREGLPAAFEDLDDSDPAVLSAVSRVRRECTEAKEALSSDTEVSIPVLMPASRGSVRLHRSEFEAMIRPHIEETVTAMRRAVASAGLEPEQLTAVLLVGGSSRIPLVAQLVSEQLGRPVAVDADPKNVIAKGAALAVSPKPTASWPGVAIAPVAAAAAAGAAAGAAMVAPPVRPPRPVLATPPQGMARPGPFASAGTPARAMAPAAAFGGAQRGPVGPSHEPATSMVSSTGSLPPLASWQARPAPAPEWNYEPEPEEPRRPVGLLIGIGGLLAAAAVVVAVMVWPESAPARISTDTGGAPTTSEVVSTPAAAVPGPISGAAGDGAIDNGGAKTDGGARANPSGGGNGGTNPSPHNSGGGGTPPQQGTVVDPPVAPPVAPPVNPPAEQPPPPVEQPPPPVEQPPPPVEQPPPPVEQPPPPVEQPPPPVEQPPPPVEQPPPPVAEASASPTEAPAGAV